jgi:hypothetical protein
MSPVILFGEVLVHQGKFTFYYEIVGLFITVGFKLQKGNA